MRTSRVVFWELVLVLASVLIFRSGWMLLDRLSLFNPNHVLWVLLAVGIAVASVSLFKLKNNEEQ